MTKTARQTMPEIYRSSHSLMCCRRFLYVVFNLCCCAFPFSDNNMSAYLKPSTTKYTGKCSRSLRLCRALCVFVSVSTNIYGSMELIIYVVFCTRMAKAFKVCNLFDAMRFYCTWHNSIGHLPLPFI